METVENQNEEVEVAVEPTTEEPKTENGKKGHNDPDIKRKRSLGRGRTCWLVGWKHRWKEDSGGIYFTYKFSCRERRRGEWQDSGIFHNDLLEISDLFHQVYRESLDLIEAEASQTA